jgi:hypothetical protein
LRVLFIRFRAMPASPAGHGLLHGAVGPTACRPVIRRAECGSGSRYP